MSREPTKIEMAMVWLKGYAYNGNQDALIILDNVNKTNNKLAEMSKLLKDWQYHMESVMCQKNLISHQRGSLLLITEDDESDSYHPEKVVLYLLRAIVDINIYGLAYKYRKDVGGYKAEDFVEWMVLGGLVENVTFDEIDIDSVFPPLSQEEGNE